VNAQMAKRTTAATLFFAALAVTTGSSITFEPTLAQEPAAGASGKPCAGDVQTLCPGVQPGGGRVIGCLRQNAAKLSPDCVRALRTAKAARQATGSAVTQPKGANSEPSAQTGDDTGPNSDGSQSK
jgi:hypothetical protein